MENYLYYCLKVLVCSGILYGYYLLALRNNRFHHWNRWYLLGSVMLSFGLPFLQIPLPDFSEKPTAITYGVELLAAPDFYFIARQPEAFRFTWVSAVALAYTGAVLLLLFLFFKNIRAIQVLKKQYREEIANGVHFYNTAEPGTPFSFFKNIFWNTGIDLNTARGQQMLRHEMAHVQEWHSADKVLLQVLLSIAFWNPFLYLIRKELSVVHEFIADQKASAGDDKLQYASLLLMKAMSSLQFALGNPFFHSQLKRRIMMLTRSTNPRFSYIRRVLVLPLAAVSLVLFSFKYKEIKEKQKAKNESNQTASITTIDEQWDDQDTTKKRITIKVEGEYKGEPIESIEPTTDSKGVMVKTTGNNVYFLNRQEARQQLNVIITDSGFITPPGARLLLADKTITVPAKGAYVKVAPDIDFKGYQYQIDTTISVDQLTPGIGWLKHDSNGVPSDKYSNYIEIGKPMGAPSIIRLQDPATGNFIIRSKTDTSHQPLYMVEGKEILPDEMKAIDPSKIQSINVLKGTNATAKYGVKGWNGVVEITLKNGLPDNALYLVDGIESTSEKVQAIKPDNIQSINVWKGEDAIRKWGEKARNGVVSVRLKSTPDWFNENTLFIKDGREVSFKETTGLGDKGLIKSYSEMPPAAAMKTYGEKGKNGAVIFTTKLAQNEVTFSEENQNNRSADLVVIGHKTVTDSAAAKTRTASTLVKQPEDLKEVVVVGYGKKRSDIVFTKVEQPASFPGGIDGWRRYLERNLKYPAAAQENGTQGTVRVQMTVAEDGNITELKALNDPGNGLAAEAERVIAKGPKWVPAIQNGRAVTYRFVQTLTFQLQ